MPRAHKPKPFQRPSVLVKKHDKLWQNLRAAQLTEGDIVIGMGMIRAVGLSQESVTVFHGQEAAPQTLDPDQQLRVFGAPR